MPARKPLVQRLAKLTQKYQRENLARHKAYVKDVIYPQLATLAENGGTDALVEITSEYSSMLILELLLKEGLTAELSKTDDNTVVITW